MKKILVTGAAGFIGFHVSQKLLAQGHRVVGYDSINDYYDVRLKESRRDQLLTHSHFEFVRADLEDRKKIDEVFQTYSFDRVIHLAAQAGVRYSLTHPEVYIQSNIVGFLNILEACRSHEVEHLVYASSSSVYGANTQMPFSIHQNVDHPISLYAATKKSNELMAHTYSHLYSIPTTGLRFFTVYGPWGRPDMALFLFTRAILKDQPIDVFNHGKMKRDFTYIDDIVEGVIRISDTVPKPLPTWSSQNPDPATSKAPYQIYNIGNHQPVRLMDFIEAIEEALDKKAKKNYLDLQPGDVPETFADVSDLSKDIGYEPSTPIKKGVGEFVKWYRDYYKV